MDLLKDHWFCLDSYSLSLSAPFGYFRHLVMEMAAICRIKIGTNKNKPSVLSNPKKQVKHRSSLGAGRWSRHNHALGGAGKH